MFKMLIGLPASGKSSIAEHNKRFGYIVHSSDELREEMLSDVNNQANNAGIFEELHKRIIYDLELGNDIIYDATNLSHKRRRAFLEKISHIDTHKACEVVLTPYDECIERNNKREKKVPEHVIKKMRESFYMPHLNEGWDNIILIANSDMANVPTTVKKIDDLMEFEQNNPNHSSTLGHHSLRCHDYLLYKGIDDVNLSIAALLHDIGKEYTKVFHNMKGESTDIAHYYNHHHVSSYEAAIIMVGEDYRGHDIVDICNLIQWHMQPYFATTEKAIKKFKRLIGEDNYERIMLLNEADKNSK